MTTVSQLAQDWQLSLCYGLLPEIHALMMTMNTVFLFS